VAGADTLDLRSVSEPVSELVNQNSPPAEVALGPRFLGHVAFVLGHAGALDRRSSTANLGHGRKNSSDQGRTTHRPGLLIGETVCQTWSSGDHLFSCRW